MPALTAALLLASALSAAPPAAPRRWAVFYGNELSRQAQESLELLVVDPDSFTAPKAKVPLKLAYLSAGEADESRWTWAKAKDKPYLVEANPEWKGAHRVDVRDKDWKKLFETAASSALAKGYQGFMIDTIDVAEYLESSAPARFKGAKDAAIGLVQGLRAKHPKAYLMLNNGLPLLPALGSTLDAVIVEDLYTTCGPKDEACKPASHPDKEADLDAFRKKTGKPVFVLLYARLHQREEGWVKAAVRRCRARGYTPYLAGPTLERFGVVEPFPKE
jgi:uncharacterized protein (TIGR01370 family)